MIKFLNKNLYLLVENFSSATQEEFFEKELPYHCQRFEKVIVIPLYKGNISLNYSSEKIEVRQFDIFGACNRAKVLFSKMGLISAIFIFELSRTHHKLFYFRKFRSLLDQIIYRVAAAEKFEKTVKDDIQVSVFYSFWFSHWANILSILKKKNPDIKVVTRAHGSDYKEEQTGRVIPFRYFELSLMDQIYTVSNYAKKYLQDKFRVNPSRITVSRLGIERESSSAPVDSKNLVLVSCSSIIPLKRVHLIPQILKSINISVTWYHFGSGPGKENIEKDTSGLPSNVTVNLMGHVPNEKFLSFLESNAVSFFLNVSEHEGLPVTLMEAASFGIPLIGTDVGGVSEIVTGETGYLVKKDFKCADLAIYIVQQHEAQKIYDKEFRQKIRMFFEENFSAKKNYSRFANQLASI